MLQYTVICLTAFFTSFLTLFSGFGLGTLLMPVFALFFPLPISIAATAVVHLANNLFKAGIVSQYADKETVVKFGIPAAIAAVIGAYLLSFVSNLTPLFSYHIFHHQFDVTLIGLVIGVIVIFSALFEFIKKPSKLTINEKYIILGGLLSGFFGGLSGYQGVLRSAFLIKAGLTKEQFIGTTVICSILVDIVRLSVYGWSAYTTKFMQLSSDMLGITLAATSAAFVGAYIGTRFMGKITYKSFQIIVGIMLIIIGFAMIFGLTN